MIASAWVAHGLYPFVISHDPIQTVSNFLKSRSTNHMFRQAIAVLKCNCASFIVLGVQQGVSDGPAGREVGFDPIVKHETVIALINASGAVPWRQGPPPSFASHSVRVVSIRNALSPCHE
jgi:hypothetical protein